MKLKERDGAGEDACTPFCLHGIVAEVWEHRGRILQSRAVLGGSLDLKCCWELKILVNHALIFF